MRFQSGMLAATEGLIGLAYDTNDTNLYRHEFVGHIEFLPVDVEKSKEEKDGESVSAKNIIIQPVRGPVFLIILL